MVQDGAREVHEITQWCTRLRSGARARAVHDGARDYEVVHDIVEWCAMVHEEKFRWTGSAECHDS